MILTQSHDGSASDTNHADVSDANLPRLQAIQRPTAALSYAMCSSLSISLCISNTFTFGLSVILGFIENHGVLLDLLAAMTVGEQKAMHAAGESLKP